MKCDAQLGPVGPLGQYCMIEHAKSDQTAGGDTEADRRRGSTPSVADEHDAQCSFAVHML